MSQDPDSSRIQEATAVTGQSRITVSPVSTFPQSAEVNTDVHVEGVPLIRRLRVLGAGLALGAAFALWVDGPMMPSGMQLSARAFVWASVMGGPIVGRAWGIDEYYQSISLGWLGLLLIPAHPLRPSVGTGCLTMLGFCLWFLAGFIAMMAAVWGA